MNNRTPIINELQTLAPGLAHLPVAMPYTVPHGYFETLAPILLTTLTTGDLPLLFLPKDKKMPYVVPQGYFENLAQAIVTKVHMAQAVPEGYFDALPAILLNKIRHQEVTQELETIAPVLNTISKQPVQTVPEGYFEQLQPPADQFDSHQIPIASIKKRMSWLKYAAAASIVLLLSFGAYRYFDQAPSGGIVAVPPEQVEKLDNQLAQLDNETIENYLQENESVTELNANWSKNAQEDDIDLLLQDFTDQELQQQLKENTDLTATTKKKDA